ncbi:MAG: hypothetical protein M1456_04900 [Actinobacteria bacterium]|nr:hypothetical protein [Actinomycetota bacterium]
MSGVTTGNREGNRDSLLWLSAVAASGNGFRADARNGIWYLLCSIQTVTAQVVLAQVVQGTKVVQAMQGTKVAQAV